MSKDMGSAVADPKRKRRERERGGKGNEGQKRKGTEKVTKSL